MIDLRRCEIRFSVAAVRKSRIPGSSEIPKYPVRHIIYTRCRGDDEYMYSNRFTTIGRKYNTAYLLVYIIRIFDAHRNVIMFRHNHHNHGDGNNNNNCAEITII